MKTRLPYLTEFVFLVAALVLGLIGAMVLIGGLSPFESGVMTGVVAAIAVIFLGHHIWYARHRDEIEHHPDRLAARERRGF
jgi:membrane protein YdbS with pleckstrin-like domain